MHLVLGLNTFSALLPVAAAIFIPRLIAPLARNSSTRARIPVQNANPRLPVAVLLVSAVIALLSTLPFFQQENIFQNTKSRVTIPVDVLRSRIEMLRQITPRDNLFLSRLAQAPSNAARRLIAIFGPKVFTECSFCTSDSPSSFMIYALPLIVFPHLLHIATIGIATSGFLCPAGKKFRLLAAAFALLFAIVEVTVIGVFCFSPSVALPKNPWLYWTTINCRGIVISLLDTLLALAIWLDASGKYRLHHGDQKEYIIFQLETILNRIVATRLVRAATLRNQPSQQVPPELASRINSYINQHPEILPEIAKITEKLLKSVPA